ncbi:LOW QUALITY PROTEIN: polycystin-1-like [Osmerus mordax]|uniref:LOW QUALITY PROTEIN: polycystin-1-like n=1 Tax=Osmerus mordax TaxID=8014 RepID=UPI0035101624
MELGGEANDERERESLCESEGVCEKEIKQSLPSPDSYLTGVPLMSAVYAKTQLRPLPIAPATGQLRVEMLLFPGLWFSHAGQVESVELVVQPSQVWSLARVHILRPYCRPSHHLVPPGCSSLLNPFSVCSSVPLCNTTGGCARGRYWCHLQEACVPVTSPCSPYQSLASPGGHRYPLPPRYRAVPPLYHQVADLPLRVEPSVEQTQISVVLPEREILVFPDDILAVQSTRPPGTFLHCRTNGSSPWRQSYLSLRGKEWGGWWEGGLSSPPEGGVWVDGLECDLRMLYVDTLHGHGTGQNHLSGFTHASSTPITRAMTPSPAPAPSPISGLGFIHPRPDADHRIHILVDVPTLVVVKILSGEGATSSWSAPVLQTGVIFQPACPEELPRSWAGCEREPPGSWFSWALLVLPSVGERSVRVKAVNGVSSQSAGVQVWAYEQVAGLHLGPSGRLRMLVGVSQLFSAMVEKGSSVRFTWVIDGLENFAYEGDSYSVVFKKPSQYKLTTVEVILTADVMTPIAQSEFVSVNEVIAVAATHLYSFRVKVDISLGVTFRWDFGDGRGQVNHTHPALYESKGEELLKGGVRQVYVQDSASHVYLQPDDYTVKVHVYNSYDSVERAMTVKVRLPLTSLSISPLLTIPLVNNSFLLEASPEPSVYGILYTWNFDDGSKEVQGFRGQVSHVVAKAGSYNVTVSANNTLTALTSWVTVTVLEAVAGLRLSYKGPNELNSATEIHGEVASGSNLVWVFDFGDGSGGKATPDSSSSHVYESAGNYTATVTVSNSVSQASQSLPVEVFRLSIRVLQPVGCVRSGEEIPLQAQVNGDVSSLVFRWSFGDGSPWAIHEGNSTAAHIYSSPGVYRVNVTILSPVGSAFLVADVCTQAPIQDLTVGPFQRVLALGEEVCLNAVVNPKQTAGYQFLWTLFPSFGKPSVSTNLSVIYTFTEAGDYEVSLNVSNMVSWEVVSHRVTVQEAVRGLILNVSTSSVCTEDTVVFTPAVSKGSDVTFSLTFQESGSVIEFAGGGFATSDLPAGAHSVTARAWNQVSRSQVVQTVQVIERIQGLRLVSPSSAILEALKEVNFQAEVTSGSPTNYTWMFHPAGSQPEQVQGQEVMFSSPGSGLLSVGLVADNGVCAQTVNESFTVQRPVREVTLECTSTQMFTGYPVTFLVAVDGGTDLRFHWDFGDADEVVVTDTNTVSHAYRSAAQYSVQLTASNSISQVSSRLRVEVSDLQCSLPEVSLVQTRSTIPRSRYGYFEASIHAKTCTTYKTTYQWKVYEGSDCGSEDVRKSSPLQGRLVALGAGVDVTSPFLSLPGRTLDVGHFCLVFTTRLQGTPLQLSRSSSLSVVHSPLVAVIKGGSQRLWPGHSDLILDGSLSHDPDVEPGGEEGLEYHWGFISRVSVSQAQVLPVTVECVSCRPLSSLRVGVGRPVVLSGSCEQCDGRAEYQWTAMDQTGLTLDLDEVTTSTGGRSPDLVLRPGVLRQGLTLTLNVTQPGGGYPGSASLTLSPYPPPRGGQCSLTPGTDMRLLETVVTYTCSGWQDSAQLIYSLQVAPCPPSKPACPLLTLYRGTQSTFRALVPLGNPGPEKHLSIISVILQVEDHLGSKVTALNRTLSVRRPGPGEVAREWLKNRSRTELQSALQHGNPQDLIPYCISLSSLLNQVERTQPSVDLQERREIRGEVTRALASLPVSSLHQAALVSSALAQATEVPGEACCQEKVLEALGRMTHVMEQHTEPGDTVAIETGKNILTILGSYLASSPASLASSSSSQSFSSTSLASSPASPSSSPASPSSSPSSPSSPSRTAVCALSLAGALMRSLMRRRSPGEEPLALSTPRIDTLGFRGDPSRLLCTDDNNPRRSNQSDQSQPASRSTSSNDEQRSSSPPSPPPCQFLIPVSLGDQLRKRGSEVVQIVLSIDGGGWTPLLTPASPPISTKMAAMEFTTPQGQPIPIQDLDPDRAIRVTLDNTRPMGVGGARPGMGHMGVAGRVEGGGGEEGMPPGLNVTLLTNGWVNFTVEAGDWLKPNAGLFITFNFSLLPGAAVRCSGEVRILVTSQGGPPASQNALLREISLFFSNASDSLEETVFLSPLSLCQYYSLEEGRWSSAGLQPLGGSSLRTASCLTQHLTLFGASMFVHPEALVLLPPEGVPVRNVLVGVVCAVVVGVHLLLGQAAHRMDLLERLRLVQGGLCGPPGPHHYWVLVKTGWRRGAGTTAHVGISLHGVSQSGGRHLGRPGAFQRSSLDLFHLQTHRYLGEVWKIRLWHDNTGLDPSWYVQHVVVLDPQSDRLFYFLVDGWLSVDQRSPALEREVLASCPEDLSQFRRVLSSQLIYGLTERHLWLSLWERPAHSRFTRGQRVTCCALLLHLYLGLGALWYGATGTHGHSGPVSFRMLVTWETVAVGMVIAVMVFPLQCLLCFLFRKTRTQVPVDISTPPSPVCQSVEMDVYLGQSEEGVPSFLSCIWGLTSDPCGGEALEVVPARVLKRKKALMKLRLAPAASLPSSPPSSPSLSALTSPSPSALTSPFQPSSQVSLGQNHTLTLSEESLLRSIAADVDPDARPPPSSSSPSDSGRFSPRTSSLTNTWSCGSWGSGWSELSVDKPAYGEDIHKTSSPCPSLSSPCPSPSAYSMASTGIPSPSLSSPSPSPDSTPAHSPTRIGVCRGDPGLELPPWALRVLYPLVALVLGACLGLVGLYGASFPSRVLLMWLLSAGSALLTSALLLETLKVCVQAVWEAVVWRPVDPEVDERLAQESCVTRQGGGEGGLEGGLEGGGEGGLEGGGEGGKVRPPCGFALLQALEEARKVRALHALIKSCVGHLLFLLLVLMVNYQACVEESQGRRLRSSLTHSLLHTHSLSSVTGLGEAWLWLDHALVPHLYEDPALRLVGLPRLRRRCGAEPVVALLLGNSSEATRALLSALLNTTRLTGVAVDFTHYHTGTGVFVCVSVGLEWSPAHALVHSLSVSPVLIPPSSSGPGLQVVLMVLLLLCSLLLLSRELWAMATEHAQYLRQGWHWLQLFLASLSLATAVLRLNFLSQATSCLLQLRVQPLSFIRLHSAALLARRASQLAALLLTLLLLKLVGTLGLVQRWVVIGRVLQRSWRELGGVALMLTLLLLLCSHTGHLLFCSSVEGFESLHAASVSVLELLRGGVVQRRLCAARPCLGTLFCLLLQGAALGLLARLAGATLLTAYRCVQGELCCPAAGLQDYHLVEFFIKRLKLWMGLTRTKEFRHRVQFEGMEAPPSRFSQESLLSSPLSPAPSPPPVPPPPPARATLSPPSPRPPSSSLSSPLSVGSGWGVCAPDRPPPQAPLDRLLPTLALLLGRFDQVLQLTLDIQSLEERLEEATARRRRRLDGGAGVEETEGGGVCGSLSSPPRSSHLSPPRTRCSESSVAQPHLHTSRDAHPSKAAQAAHGSSVLGLGAGPPGGLPRRRAWHSGSSHSADAL